MRKYEEGDWYVFEETSTKSFERFKIEASRGLMQGFSGLFTSQRWEGTTCHVGAIGATGKVTFEHGTIKCRVRISPLGQLFKSKILSDIETITRDVSGSIGSENQNVFIVHGHNEAKRIELQTFLGKLGLKPVVLIDQDDKGMTIIEKFEYYAADSAFSFVLMTPDDKTTTGDTAEQKWRARQNVIMELGWFMARLGRERVVILYQGDLEIPSDIYGVVYLKFEDSIYEVSEQIRQRLRGVGLVS